MRPTCCCSPKAGTNAVDADPASDTTCFDGCEVVVEPAHREPAGGDRPARGRRCGRGVDRTAGSPTGARQRQGAHSARDSYGRSTASSRRRCGWSPPTSAAASAPRVGTYPRSCSSVARPHARPAGARGPRPAPRTCWRWATAAARCSTSTIGGTQDGRIAAYRLDVAAGRRRLPGDRRRSCRS